MMSTKKPQRNVGTARNDWKHWWTAVDRQRYASRVLENIRNNLDLGKRFVDRWWSMYSTYSIQNTIYGTIQATLPLPQKKVIVENGWWWYMSVRCLYQRWLMMVDNDQSRVMQGICTCIDFSHNSTARRCPNTSVVTWSEKNTRLLGRLVHSQGATVHVS